MPKSVLRFQPIRARAGETAGWQSAGGDATAALPDAAHHPARLLVRLAPNSTRSDREALLVNAGVSRVLKEFRVVEGLLLAEVAPDELTEAKRLAARMADRALRLGGTITGEHGIGIGKLAHMRAEHGDAWEVMGAIKRALDPANILNPGKLVPGN